MRRFWDENETPYKCLRARLNKGKSKKKIHLNLLTAGIYKTFSKYVILAVQFGFLMET